MWGSKKKTLRIYFLPKKDFLFPVDNCSEKLSLLCVTDFPSVLKVVNVFRLLRTLELTLESKQ